MIAQSFFNGFSMVSVQF